MKLEFPLIEVTATLKVPSSAFKSKEVLREFTNELMKDYEKLSAFRKQIRKECVELIKARIKEYGKLTSR